MSPGARTLLPEGPMRSTSEWLAFAVGERRWVRTQHQQFATPGAVRVGVAPQVRSCARSRCGGCGRGRLWPERPFLYAVRGMAWQASLDLPTSLLYLRPSP